VLAHTERGLNQWTGGGCPMRRRGGRGQYLRWPGPKLRVAKWYQRRSEYKPQECGEGGTGRRKRHQSRCRNGKLSFGYGAAGICQQVVKVKITKHQVRVSVRGAAYREGNSKVVPGPNTQSRRSR